MDTIRVPKICRRQYDDLQWLVNVRSDDPRRDILQYVACKGKQLIATDGKRMHILDITEYPETWFDDGSIYEVLADKGKELILQKRTDYTTANYPDIDCVMPNIEYVADSILQNGSIESISSAMFRVSQCGVCLNIDYVKDALKAGSMWFGYKDYQSPVLLFNDDDLARQSIIMPMIPE